MKPNLLRLVVALTIFSAALARPASAAEELDQYGRPVIPPAAVVTASATGAAGGAAPSASTGRSLATPAGTSATDPHVATGESEAPLRLAVVDLDRITRDSSRIRGRIGAIEERLSAYSTEVEALQADIDRQRLELVRRRALMIPEEIDRRERAIRLAEERVEAIRFRARRLTSRLETEVVEPSLREIIQVTRDFATEAGFDLVLRRDLVLFASPRADLTETVMARLDALGAADAVFLGEEEPLPGSAGDPAATFAPDGTPKASAGAIP
jgi:Skp family chaperone for outer membrane proteins